MTALFIGRFQPFHKGHLAAIKWILRKERKIFIVIGSSQESFTKKNPFPLPERKKMISKALRDENIRNFKIYAVPDFANDILWAKNVLKTTRSQSLVFTCNPWTKRCFRKVGVEVKAHPIFFNKLSGTKIRKKIREGEEWENLVPKPVFTFLKKINCEKRIKSLT